MVLIKFPQQRPPLWRDTKIWEETGWDWMTSGYGFWSLWANFNRSSAALKHQYSSYDWKFIALCLRQWSYMLFCTALRKTHNLALPWLENLVHCQQIAWFWKGWKTNEVQESVSLVHWWTSYHVTPLLFQTLIKQMMVAVFLLRNRTPETPLRDESHLRIMLIYNETAELI